MKPNFALSLSFEGIKLLHRAAGGWREVGEVEVTAPDLAGELAMLRKTATSLEPGGLRTKLVIPASQIKYLTIETAGLSGEARRIAAETALQGATPYEVSELAYDISMDGARTHVAAVARETLAEAEAFAAEHRFHPVSFVAVPGDAPYLGEPFFGPTKGAAALLEPGESVEPDGIAVVIVGAVAPKEDKSEPPAVVEPDIPEIGTPAEPTLQDTVPVEIEDPAAPEVQEPTAPEVPDTDLAEAPEPTVQEVHAPKAPAQTDHEQKTPAPDEVEEDPVAKSEPAPSAPAGEAPKPEPVAPPSKQPELDLGTAAGSAPEAVTPEARAPGAPPVAVPSAPAPVKPAPVKPAAAAPERTTPAAPAVGAPNPAAAGAAPVEGTPKTSFSSRRNGAPPVGAAMTGVQRIAVNTPRPDSSSLSKPAPVPLEDAPAATPVLASATARIKSGFLSRRKPRTGAAAPIAAPAVAVPATGTEAERMTVFGARSQQVGGKPRFLGLIMTVVLLVFLAGVAAWAAVFLDDGIAGLMKDDRGRATASAPENQIDPEIIRTPEGIEASAPDVDAVQIAALDPVLSAEDTAVLDAMQDPRPQPQIPVISEEEAAARYAVTGIWPLSPETPLTDGPPPAPPVYRSSIDPVSTASDALALPAPAQFDTDVQLAAVVSPPPFGQQTALDADGLIVPTPEGVVTPEGFTLVAASPPLKPPATLTRFATQPGVEAPEASETAVLVAYRPQNRPLGLGERTERAQLGGVTLGELAVYRPTLRPSSLQDRAREAQEAEEAARAAEEAASAAATLQSATNAAAAAAAASALVVPQPVVAAVAPAIVNATRLATPQSQRPDARPRNFDRIVSRAERAAPAEETRVAAAASVAPRTVAPSIPSTASVARSATVKNAINLRRVNLIGVYGKPNSRRALIRLSNGRYQKVKVGDRIDGGRVAAISNSELRYTKGGRNVVLTMP